MTRLHPVDAPFLEVEASYRILISQLPALTFTVSPNWRRMLSISPQVEALLGFTQEECLAHPMMWVERLHPDDRERAIREFERCRKTGEPFNMEYRMLARDGREVWFSGHLAQVYDPVGKPVHAQGVALDITASQTTLEALRKSEARQRMMLNQMPAVLWVTDTALRFTTCTGAALGAIGLTPDTVVGKSVLDFFPEDHPAIVAHHGALRGESVAYSVDFGGRVFQAHVEPKRDARQAAIGCIGVALDITERMQAERSLTESKQRLQALFDNAMDAILLVDDERRLVDVNPAACALLGYRREELVGMHAGNLVTSEQEERAHEIRRQFNAAGKMAGEYTFLRKDGQTRDTEFCAVKNILPGLHLSVVRDVTERKRVAIGAARYAKRLQALSRRMVELQEADQRALAAELHDRVGHALSALSINLRIISDELSPGSVKLVSRLADSRALVEGLASTVRNVITELRPAVLDDYGLLAALRWYAESFEKRTGVETAIFGQPVERLPPPVEAALFRLSQEAMTNVAKHAGATHITITLEVADGVNVTLVVEDNGAGFDTATLFKPGKESGWGLLMMRERIESVGGKVVIDSAPGGGTRIAAEWRGRP